MKTMFEKNNPKKAKRFFEKKMTYTTGPAELKEVLNSDQRPVVVDVRAAKDFAQGHVPGAINLPQEQWESLEGMEQDKLHVVYCYSQVCHLAAKACVFFADAGFSVMEMEGGIKGWREHEYPLEPPMNAKKAA